MPPNRTGYLIIGLIVLLFGTATALLFSSPISYTDPLGMVIRLCALYGFLLIAITTMITPFLGSVGKAFGRPFLRIHHIFAGFGIALITVHPISVAIQAMTPLVFIPTARSWMDFWINAGRPALIILYVALLGAFLRTQWKQWRYVHVLMYPVLLFAIVHAILIGTDFAKDGIRILYTIVFVGTVLVLILNIRRKIVTKNKAQQKRQMAKGG